MIPVGEGFFCPGTDQGVFAVQKNLAVIADSLLDWQGLLPQLFSGAAGSFKGMPDGEDGPGLLEHISGKTVGVGTGTAVFESFQLSDEMGPAELADALFMVGIIGRMVVAGNDPGEVFAQHFFQHLGASAGRNEEEDGTEGDKGPEIASFAFVFPAGLVDVEVWGGGDILFDNSNYRNAGLGDTLWRCCRRRLLRY